MALITDPDNLSQGFSTAVADGAWTASSGATTVITGAATLPALGTGDYFEVRDHSVPGNNGLYLTTGTPTTSSISATKQTGINPVNSAAEAIRVLGRNNAAGDEKMVHFNVDAREIWVLGGMGNVSDDGVTLQTLYSFAKEEWKDDADLIQHPFPYTAITPEQFELTDSWNFNNDTTRKLVRTGGWREISSAGILQQEWVGVVTLGSFEDSTPGTGDLAYYQQGSDPTDTTAGTNFAFTGPVNEAVKSYDLVTTVASYTSMAITTSTITRTSGSWITEGYRKGGQITIIAAEDAGNIGTFVISALSATVLTVVGTPLTINAADTAMVAAVNNRNVLNVFLRVRDADPNGKTFAQSNLAAIGTTAVDNKVFRFPLSNATDLKITATDATITGSSPYTQIKTRYFDQAFTLEVDDPVTNRNFGIVIDVGTHSGVDGSTVAAGSTLTTAEGGITGADYIGGTLTVHDGTPDGTTYTISGTPGATTVAITGTFPATEGGLSFTLQRATPVVATAEQIYAKIQYLLRQAADIDSTDQTITGRTADALLRFVGDTLECGQALPSNPNFPSGKGVIIVGFSANDTNRLKFYDNGGVSRNYPFVAAGTINFNANLVNDGSAKYWMFYEYVTRKSVADLAISAVSGSTASIDSAGANLPVVAKDDYINILGATSPNNNGIWIVTDASPTTSQFDARKVDGLTVAAQTAFAGTIDDNPVNSPQAIIVNDNSGTPITGTIGGPSVGFDYDYDNNVQGGRTAGTNAAIRLRAIGLVTGQFVETTGTITQATGLSFSLVAALERNYANA